MTIWSRSLRLLPVVGVVVGILPIAGCSPPPRSHAAGAIALVVGGRSNMHRPRLSPQAHRLVQDAVLSGDTLFIVGVSGTSQPPLYTEDIATGCDSKPACDAVLRDYTTRINELLDEVKAQSKEADTLGAITVAARSLAGVDKPGPKQLLVIDNGLQTTGALPLQSPGALAVAPTEQATYLAKSGDLPDLRGVDVTLSGVGDSYRPQPPLTEGERKNLVALWTAILRKAGALRVDADSAPLADEPPLVGLPSVTPIVPDPTPVVAPSGCVRIREDQIGFLPNKAVFKDSSAAGRVLRPIVAEIVRKRAPVTVTGTTALPEDPPFPLSKARANAVISLLVGLGVDRRLLNPQGVGVNFPGFVPDEGPDGTLIPAKAQQNRLVIIQPAGGRCS